MSDLREALAAQAHESWSGWVRYLFSKCDMSDIAGVIIPGWAARRWHRQMNTPYAELPEDEKESDRKEADEYLAVITAWNRRVAPATGWISVDERLPERGVRVEANAAGGYVFIGYRDAYRKWYEDDNYPIYHVTHWQPLPLPPGSEPAPDDERAQLGEALIRWAARPSNIFDWDEGLETCVLCGGGYHVDGEVWHAPDCLHLRARKLQERGDDTR